jgi:hypothetical protein
MSNRTKKNQMPKQPKVFSPSGYFRVRLEHTLKHTQQSTRLIYLVNGAALGALYFAAKMEEIALYRRQVIVSFLFILAIINFIHACLIKRQGQWYSIIDRAFASTSQATMLDRPKGFPWFGTHDLYAALHFVLAAAFAVAGLWAWSVF